MTQSAPLVSIIGPPSLPQKRKGGLPTIVTTFEGQALIRELNMQQHGLPGIGFITRKYRGETLLAWRDPTGERGSLCRIPEPWVNDVLIAITDEAARLRARAGTQLWLTGVFVA